jgi:hypothetical protein
MEALESMLTSYKLSQTHPDFELVASLGVIALKTYGAKSYL